MRPVRFDVSCVFSFLAYFSIIIKKKNHPRKIMARSFPYNRVCTIHSHVKWALNIHYAV